MSNKRKAILLLLGVIVFTACKSTPDSLVVMTHDSFTISEDTITAFEKENNVEVVFLPGGDAGSTLNRAVLMKASLQWIWRGSLSK